MFSRLFMISQTTSTPIDMKDILRYELTPMPLFRSAGSPIFCKSKSVMKADLQIQMNSRITKLPDFSILDGCAILWIIQWYSTKLYYKLVNM